MGPDVRRWGGSVRWRPVGVLAALVVGVLVGERALARVVAGVVAGADGFPAWFPHFRSVGETVVFYGTVFDVLKFVVIPAALVWVGYVYGRHHAGASDTDQ